MASVGTLAGGRDSGKWREAPGAWQASDLGVEEGERLWGAGRGFMSRRGDPCGRKGQDFLPLYRCMTSHCVSLSHFLHLSIHRWTTWTVCQVNKPVTKGGYYMIPLL